MTLRNLDRPMTVREHLRHGSLPPHLGSKVSVRMQWSQGADIASANDLTLGYDGNTFAITGTTQINRIVNTGWQNGSITILHFTSTPLVKDGQASSGSAIIIQLAGGGDFQAAAGDNLMVQLREIGGTQEWVEVSRTVV